MPLFFRFGRFGGREVRRKTRAHLRSWLAAAALLAAVSPAHASLSLLLEQPYGDMGLLNPTGHSAIYLDHVCADGPLKLRACRPGEMGSVISRYDGIQRLDWVAVPVLPYLYAVSSVADIPATADRALEHDLRDRYRRAHLESIAPDLPGGKTPPGNWYEVVGSAYDRTIYGFRMNTTPEQDAEIIALFNDRLNTEHYNGAFRNCADFARVLINRFYPHAVRRNFISDLGMTTPKAVARAVVHYGRKHPQMNLSMFVVPQVAGTIPRSGEVKGVAESLVKLYGIPLTLLSPTTAVITLAAYIGGGRFHLPKSAPVLTMHDELATPAAGITSADVAASTPPPPPPPDIMLPAPEAEPVAAPGLPAGHTSNGGATFAPTTTSPTGIQLAY